MSWNAPNLQNRHCFFGRTGGVSKGVFAGLNVSPKGCDNQDELEHNLDIAADFFKKKRQNFVLLNQGVSAQVFYVEKSSLFELDGDGVVTDKPNVILGLRTADCAPILLEDKAKGIIGAAHAGWRGAFKGVIENTVNLMLQNGAVIGDIAAAVGPCIAQKSYEVEKVFYDDFVQKKENYSKYFVRQDDKHYQFDLEEFCVDKLKECGVENVTWAHHDTYDMDKEYYSFRRFTHQKIVKANGGFAAQLSAIMLEE